MTNLDKFKGEIVDLALDFFKEHSGYRWSDVLDYICEHWDLDNEWEEMFERRVQAAGVSNFEVFYLRSLNDIKYKREGLTTKQSLAILIGNELRAKLEASLSKEL